ncbi:hypothetical protein [Pendulispora albinea]|uniref:Uncharacterized protein n=1 Tax=Pendulispora albinea TaxID=2741071 RepID=A0ABZ2M3Z2_9BACT
MTGFAAMVHYNTAEIAPELVTKNSANIAPKLQELKAGLEATLSTKYMSGGFAPSNVPPEYHIQWGVSWNEVPDNKLLNLKPALVEAVGDVFQPKTSGQLVGNPDAAFHTDVSGGDYGWRL